LAIASYQDLVSAALGLPAALSEMFRDRSWEDEVAWVDEVWVVGLVVPVVPVGVWVGYITE